MKFVALATTVTLAAATDKMTMVDEVNSHPGVTWKAGINARFANSSISHLLGTVMPGEEGYQAPAETVHVNLKSLKSVPESFDVRENWSSCASISGHVRDQSNCGSCWAFGSVEAFNDRHCIASGDTKTLLSPEDVAACCTGFQCSFSMGCNGGQPSGAWNWFTKTGVSTGGDFENVDDASSCKPYSLHSCAHHSDPTEDLPPCEDLPSYPTPKCTSECSDSGYKGDYKSDKLKAKSSYAVKGVDAMQQELMEKGTLSVALSVYEDFEAYTGGVYQHVTGKYLGGHAVKMIGWGVEDGTPYWLCVNSWNYSWGENGLFKILRGSNECGIEGSVVAGDV